MNRNHTWTILLASMAAACNSDPEGLHRTPVDTPLGWSADGSQLVFEREDIWASGDVTNTERCGGTGLYTVNANGKVDELHTGEAVCSALRQAPVLDLSPDNRVLLFGVQNSADGGEIYKLHLRDLAQLQLYPKCQRVDPSSPAWSPDGHRIALLSSCDSADGRELLQLLNPDGSGIRTIAAAADSGTQARPVSFPRVTWAPDGTHIAFVRESVQQGRSVPEIVVVDTTGTTLRVITAGHSPSWSPTGEWIAYQPPQDQEGRWPSTIMLIRPDGTGRQVAFTNQEQSTFRGGSGPIHNGTPLGRIAWSPDGKRLAFPRMFETGTSIWSVRTDGGTLNQLTQLQ